MYVLYNCSDGSINSQEIQEYKSFEIYAVTFRMIWLNITIW